jgi:16S rRNA (guanine966-N2)-methyltransferase
MRIIGGKLKGVIIRPPSWFNARPTTDRARESIFNILAHSIGIENQDVLDLCAGSGAMSIEFVSRGAGSVVAVDQHKKSVDFIKTLFKQYQLNNAQAIYADALAYIKKSPAEKFDIIFADPPYAWPGYQQMVDDIFKNRLLKPDGWLVVEHLQGLTLHHNNFIESRNYGQSVFSFFCNRLTVES